MTDWRYYRDRYGWSKSECAALGLDVYGVEQLDELEQEVYETEEHGAEPGADFARAVGVGYNRV